MYNMWGIVVLMVVFAAILAGHRMNKLEKKITAQQTQIDDMKRELEEMKGKMKE